MRMLRRHSPSDSAIDLLDKRGRRIQLARLEGFPGFQGPRQGPPPTVFQETGSGLLRVVYREMVIRFQPRASGKRRRDILKRHGFGIRRTNAFIPGQLVVYLPGRRPAGEELVISTSPRPGRSRPAGRRSWSPSSTTAWTWSIRTSGRASGRAPIRAPGTGSAGTFICPIPTRTISMSRTRSAMRRGMPTSSRAPGPVESALTFVWLSRMPARAVEGGAPRCSALPGTTPEGRSAFRPGIPAPSR